MHRPGFFGLGVAELEAARELRIDDEVEETDEGRRTEEAAGSESVKTRNLPRRMTLSKRPPVREAAKPAPVRSRTTMGPPGGMTSAEMMLWPTIRRVRTSWTMVSSGSSGMGRSLAALIVDGCSVDSQWYTATMSGDDLLQKDRKRNIIRHRWRLVSSWAGAENAIFVRGVK